MKSSCFLIEGGHFDSFQQKCIVSSPYYYKIIPAMSSVRIEMDVDDCAGVNSLEHVSFTITNVGQNETKVGNTTSYLDS